MSSISKHQSIFEVNCAKDTKAKMSQIYRFVYQFTFQIHTEFTDEMPTESKVSNVQQESLV